MLVILLMGKSVQSMIGARLPFTENRWLVVVNPMAGSHSAGKAWREISSLLHAQGINYEEFLVRPKLFASKYVAEAIGRGCRKVVAVGGDGTVHQVLTGIMNASCQERVTVAVIPVGSGNDWIKLYGIPKDFRKAVSLIGGGFTLSQDVGVVTMLSCKNKHSYMMNVGGVGLDAYVCRRVNLMKAEGKRGKMIYLKGLVDEYFRYRSVNAVVSCDGEKTYSGRMLSMSIGNGKYSGGGMQQTPDAKPDDGLFDVTIISHIPWWKILFKAKKLFDGSITHDPCVVFGRCSNVKVETSPGSLVEVDGEIVGMTPVSFELKRLAIDVVVPAGLSKEGQG